MRGYKKIRVDGGEVWGSGERKVVVDMGLGERK